MDSTAQNAKKPSLKHKVEAILYSVGKRIAVSEMTKLARSRDDAIRAALSELKAEYDKKDTSLTLIEDGDFWKLAVRDPYLPVVKKIVTETELSKTVIETLAVIAFKYPIKQSDLISIRTNKAYDHLKELEAQGFISRKKHGRTNLIKLTDKFFNYFDLPEEKLKEHLADFESIAKAITQREEELVKRKEQKKQELEDISSKESRIKEEIDALDANAKSPQEPKVEPYGVGEVSQGLPKVEQKLGDLEVYEEPQGFEGSSSSNAGPIEEVSASKEEGATTKGAQKEEEEGNELSGADFAKPKKIVPYQSPSLQSEKKTAQGITTTPEMDKEIEKKVERMLNPPQDEDDFPTPPRDVEEGEKPQEEPNESEDEREKV